MTYRSNARLSSPRRQETKKRGAREARGSESVTGTRPQNPLEPGFNHHFSSCYEVLCNNSGGDLINT